MNADSLYRLRRLKTQEKGRLAGVGSFSTRQDLSLAPTLIGDREWYPKKVKLRGEPPVSGGRRRCGVFSAKVPSTKVSKEKEGRERKHLRSAMTSTGGEGGKRFASMIWQVVRKRGSKWPVSSPYLLFSELEAFAKWPPGLLKAERGRGV